MVKAIKITIFAGRLALRQSSLRCELEPPREGCAGRAGLVLVGDGFERFSGEGFCVERERDLIVMKGCGSCWMVDDEYRFAW